MKEMLVILGFPPAENVGEVNCFVKKTDHW